MVNGPVRLHGQTIAVVQSHAGDAPVEHSGSLAQRRPNLGQPGTEMCQGKPARTKMQRRAGGACRRAVEMTLGSVRMLLEIRGFVNEDVWPGQITVQSRRSRIAGDDEGR